VHMMLFANEKTSIDCEFQLVYSLPRASYSPSIMDICYRYKYVQ